MAKGFLPVTAAEMRELGWEQPDFVYVTGDAYVDHPSFGLAIISRVLEKAGYRVAMLPQPDWHSCEDFKRFGRPRLGVAAMYFGAANPLLTAVGCLVFGLADSVGARLQPFGVPSQIILLMPYVVTVTVLAISLIIDKKRQNARKSSLTGASVK